MKARIVLFCLFYLVLAAGFICKTSPFEPYDSTYYFNSFETAQDTVGWNGVSTSMFVDDPAPDGGKKSLNIGGGCLMPTASKTFPTTAKTRKFSVNCWGKANEENGGGQLILAVLDGNERISEIHLHISGPDWKFYQSESSLTCPPNKKLRLEIWSGGIVYQSIRLDRVTIEQE